MVRWTWHTPKFCVVSGRWETCPAKTPRMVGPAQLSPKRMGTAEAFMGELRYGGCCP